MSALRVSLAALLLSVSGCTEGAITFPVGPDGAPLPTGVGPAPTTPTTPADPTSPLPKIPDLPSVATCNNAPSGRAYIGLAGEHLEQVREETAAYADVHRPFRNIRDVNVNWILMSDTLNSIGSANTYRDAEMKDPGVGGAFGVAPKDWYQESNVGTFAVFTTFAYAFKACRRTIETPVRTTVAGWYEYTTAEPTALTAQSYCRVAQRKAWLREPTDEQVQACVDFALDLADVPDVKDRWAYVCASVIASANYLAN